MAEDTKNGAAKKDQGPTQRVVLKRENVLVLPVTFDPKADKHREALKMLGIKDVEEAWVVVAEGVGSKTQAIEAYAGKPGTPDAKIGAFRAPNASAWAGGLKYDAPPLPLVQRSELA